MANHRTGRARGYSKQRGGAHALSWRDDEIILERINVGARPWLEKRSNAECLAIVNCWCASVNESSIGVDTLLIDRQRWRELAAERPAVTAADLVEELDHVITVAYEKLETAKANNPGTFLSTIRQAIMDKGRLLGNDAGGKDVTLRDLILAAVIGGQS